MASTAALLAQLERALKRESFSAANLFHAEQRRVRSSGSKRKALRCSRRAGKTVYEAGDLLLDVFEPPYTHQFYITISLKNAKQLVWPDLKRLNAEFGLGGIPNETEAYMRFPNIREARDVPVIYLGGAKDLNEIEKLRGHKAKKAILDEAQSIPNRIITPLLKDVIRPMLLDYSGSQIVSGTPGPLLSGYFYDIDQGSLAKQWDRFHWTWRENTELPAFKQGRTVEEIETEILTEHGWTRDNPTYRREYCGEWVRDEEALVFKYSPDRNHYDMADMPTADGWRYVLGVDLGFEDADAIAVLGWHPARPVAYLVEEHVERKAGITELGERVSEFHKRYRPVATWVDAGGLGKKITEELRRRWHVPCEPAEKQRKLEHIELLNDALRTGRFLARRDSRFAEDCAQVQWDIDQAAKGVRKIAEDFHSDITDAVLYAFRACRQYLYAPPAPPPPPIADALEAERMSHIERGQGEDWVDADMAKLGMD